MGIKTEILMGISGSGESVFSLYFRGKFFRNFKYEGDVVESCEKAGKEFGRLMKRKGFIEYHLINGKVRGKTKSFKGDYISKGAYDIFVKTLADVLGR